MNESTVFHCKKCKKSLGVKYSLKGLIDAVACENLEFKCYHCKRVITPKKYREKTIIEESKNGKFYV